MRRENKLHVGVDVADEGDETLLPLDVERNLGLVHQQDAVFTALSQDGEQDEEHLTLPGGELLNGEDVALVGESDPETDPVFDDKAWMLCPLTYADKVRPSLWHRRQDILKKMDLQADVQEKNLRTVLAAIDILKQIPGFKALADTEGVLAGIAGAARRTGFRGRWERLSELPFVICDIGHNPQALQYNFAQLRRYVEEGRCSSLIIVYGIMADKDLDGILPLMPADATYIFTAPQTARALPAGELLKRYTAFQGGRPSLRTYAADSVRQAVQMALQLAQTLSQQTNRSASASKPVPPLVFIGGSAFVVAEALPLFR